MNQQLLEELMTLKRRDTAMRAQLLEQDRLYGRYAPELQQVHQENATALNAIIAMHGWPGISLVGLEACRAAWLIAQHANCTPELQRRFLDLLTIASASGDAPKRQVALLTDRIRFNEARPQVFGTVFDWNANGELVCDVEEPETLDKRRAEFDLPLFSEALDKQREEVKAEGGKPPQDFAAYKQEAREWAFSVGWLGGAGEA